MMKDLTFEQTRILLAAFLGAIVAWRILADEKRERSSLAPTDSLPRYGGQFPVYALPIFFALILPLSLISGASIQCIGSMFATLVQISLYYCLLLPLLPLLRRVLSARGCASLWLVPSFLYFITYTRSTFTSVPALILPASRSLLWQIAAVWGAGFVLVTLWACLSHRRFRKELLDQAVPVTEEEVLAVWRYEWAYSNSGLDLTPMWSPAATTPLSIGLSYHSLRLLLPRRPYTPEQLHLIFRHELIHICRLDNCNKAFLTFLCAVCWFNPLMWVAMKKCAEDLELSCDEAVLLDADASTRRRYADLLLRTAGDSRGFTTCLAANARSMRYRLSQVVTRRRTLRGGLLAGAVLSLLMLTNGLVTVGYDVQTIGELMETQAPLDSLSVTRVRSGTNHFPSTVPCSDPEGLLHYLAGLECSRLAGNYNGPETKISMGLELATPNGVYNLAINQDALNFYPEAKPTKDDLDPWYLLDEVDWDYVLSLFPSS